MSTWRYIDSLTPLRGIAALLVVVYHFDSLMVALGFGHLLPVAAARFITKGYLWVDFFFVLSGFVICHAYGGHLAGGGGWSAVREYLLARFSRLYPLHLFSLAVHLAIFGVLLLRLPDVPMPFSAFYVEDTVPLHLFFLQPLGLDDRPTWNFPAWSIGAEWWTYFAAIPLIAFLGTGSALRRWLAVGGSLMGLWLLVQNQPEKILDVTYRYGVLRCFFDFTLGAVACRVFKAAAGHVWLSRDAAFMTALLMALLVLNSSVSDIAAVPVFALLILCAAHNAGGMHDVLNKRSLRYLGEISYSIYMMQALWLILLAAAMPWLLSHGVFGRSGLGVKWGALGVLLAADVASAALTHRYIEVPAREWLRGRLGGVSRSSMVGVG